MGGQAPSHGARGGRERGQCPFFPRTRWEEPGDRVWVRLPAPAAHQPREPGCISYPLRSLGLFTCNRAPTRPRRSTPDGDLDSRSPFSQRSRGWTSKSRVSQGWSRDSQMVASSAGPQGSPRILRGPPGALRGPPRVPRGPPQVLGVLRASSGALPGPSGVLRGPPRVPRGPHRVLCGPPWVLGVLPLLAAVLISFLIFPSGWVCPPAHIWRFPSLRPCL